MTSVSAGHIILTLTQPVGSGRPQRESNPGPPHQESRALPTELLHPPTIIIIIMIYVFGSHMMITAVVQTPIRDISKLILMLRALKTVLYNLHKNLNMQWLHRMRQHSSLPQETLKILQKKTTNKQKNRKMKCKLHLLINCHILLYN